MKKNGIRRNSILGVILTLQYVSASRNPLPPPSGGLSQQVEHQVRKFRTTEQYVSRKLHSSRRFELTSCFNKIPTLPPCPGPRQRIVATGTLRE